MNNENLRSLADRPAEERKTIASLGGIASGAARQRRRSLREALIAALECDNYEVDGHLMDGYGAVTIAIIKKAISGDPRAYQLIRDGLGEKPAERIIAEPVISDEARREVERLLFGTDETE